MNLAQLNGRWFWVAADIETAFDKVPHSRLLVACRHHFPPNVVEFISTISRTRRTRGLRQGSPISPFLFNVFADRYIDRAWQLRFLEIPLLRYADDLLVLCKTDDEARMARSALEELARSAGTPIKPGSADRICNLEEGQIMDWLGFILHRDQQRLEFRIAPAAWNRLDAHLIESHIHDNTPLLANQIVHGWIGALGPCFDVEDRASVLQRIRQIGSKYALLELPDDRSLTATWSAAYARWQRLFAANDYCSFES